MRACETVSDATRVINSNPVHKLSLEKHSLTRRGVDQAIRASDALVKEGLSSDAWIWPSVTISAFQTAEIVASKLRIRREQIVPEFSFLDARGVGALDGGKTSEVRRVLEENDKKDSSWRPQAGEDGTPNDSSQDVFVRVTQLLNKLETQYFGENIIIVSPDSDPLSILQATMTGQDLTTHHQFEYQPGEVRKVKELVTDDYGKPIIQPQTFILSKPDETLRIA
ncbi:Histidine phosphatase [Gracilaria domingensis]|nr:Histidine phosphatase [Gracilaria domingensis]